MATVKITITLEEEQMEDVRRLMAAGKADSVPGFVKHAVDVALGDADELKRLDPTVQIVDLH